MGIGGGGDEGGAPSVPPSAEAPVEPGAPVFVSPPSPSPSLSPSPAPSPSPSPSSSFSSCVPSPRPSNTTSPRTRSIICSSAPINVYVFPVPVCPYKISVACPPPNA